MSNVRPEDGPYTPPFFARPSGSPDVSRWAQISRALTYKSIVDEYGNNPASIAALVADHIETLPIAERPGHTCGFFTWLLQSPAHRSLYDQIASAFVRRASAS